MAEQAEKKNTYISLHKNFVRTDIEYTDPKTGEKKTFNSVTLPQGTVIDGKDVGGYQFSPLPGEVQSHELMQTWTSWTAIALVVTGLLKAIATPTCINLGWMGGNFCPSIFAGAACGYGLSMVTGADPMLMVTVVTTGFLAGVTRKPVLSIAILMLCFPAQDIIWMGLAAIIASVLPVPQRRAV